MEPTVGRYAHGGLHADEGRSGLRLFNPEAVERRISSGPHGKTDTSWRTKVDDEIADSVQTEENWGAL
ncbi:hypothetical protein ACFTZI_00020 [Streptomyces decoyicus]|uniref:hypothetical protein n=1 Tax=Streptomyces decoyicus TaxID=249567 RepID=UPI0036396A21